MADHELAESAQRFDRRMGEVVGKLTGDLHREVDELPPQVRGAINSVKLYRQHVMERLADGMPLPALSGDEKTLRNRWNIADTFEQAHLQAVLRDLMPDIHAIMSDREPSLGEHPYGSHLRTVRSAGAGAVARR